MPYTGAMQYFKLLFMLTLMSALKVYGQEPSAYGQNLWLNYSENATTFKLWSPGADQVQLRIYSTGNDSDAIEQHALVQSTDGIWTATLVGDYHGRYYTYQVDYNGEALQETPGIYATAVGVNGWRAMVCDMQKTNPAGWKEDTFRALSSPTDAILYELHVRDLSIHPQMNSEYPGKFLGIIEEGKKTTAGASAGLDHLKELGITHVHLLPSFDHYSIDETRLDKPQYNWGYDPQNYNVPEGSYSTDPYNASVRIKEFKTMVQKLHQENIGVILDVVYNHTGRTDNSPFNLEYPGYYYRFNKDSSYSNSSGCGNETASEKPMMRHFIIESCKHWMKEYHIDGFRFDLMGIHDQETMSLLSNELKKINPEVLIYGEGWTAGDSPLPERQRSLKKYTHKIYPVAAFSDDLRDGLKGSVFNKKDTGFVSGLTGTEQSIAFGVVGAIAHPDVNMDKVNYSEKAWAIEPTQCINYVSCHDNHTLWDKLKISKPLATQSERIEMHKLALGIVLTSQGIPFLHAGTEFLRTKGGEHNSYKSPDPVNLINWDRKDQYKEIHQYVRELIQLRKNHPSFSMGNAETIRKHLQFTETSDLVVSYEIKNVPRDDWKAVRVYYNGNEEIRFKKIPGKWSVAIDSGTIVPSSDRVLAADLIELAPRSMTILYQK